nr:hypothetical protein H0235_008024 [Vespula pensylvanica]
MHPACAQRIEGADMPTCHSLAETCKKNEAYEQIFTLKAFLVKFSALLSYLDLYYSCLKMQQNYKFFGMRLEHYEQNCAVDSVTKKCAGPPSDCRKAMLGILGTELRSNCACKGTDFTQLYDCLGWQRLLWVNPCVGKRVNNKQTLEPFSRVSKGLPRTSKTPPLFKNNAD